MLVLNGYKGNYHNMSKGYIVIAQNNDTTDYLEQAYALALNLKLTQSTVSNLTVCVDPKTKSSITQKHKKVLKVILRFFFYRSIGEQF